MNDIAISVENLGKSYLVGHKRGQSEQYTALRDELARAVRNLGRTTRDIFLGRPIVQGDEIEEFWALKAVSFEIQRGERVGVIGTNGAGKSTLLKILSRITEPTTGRVKIAGRVASLLEVGTGFHPELTGRENIYLNGAILGMSRQEIKLRFDEIVAFAEVEQFLDTPVKRYSSGMYVRLAFSVAAHLETEILIVDEVLAVGDAAFQRKCLGKMEDVGKDGRTVLFVSHNMPTVQKLCSKGIVLREGGVHYAGNQLDAVSSYLSLQDLKDNSLATRIDRQGTGEVRIQSINFLNGNALNVDSAMSGEELRIRLHFEKKGIRSHSRLIASITVKTQLEVPVFMIHSRLTGDYFGTLPEQGFFELRIPRLPLPSGVFCISYSLMEDGVYIDAIQNAGTLIVSGGDFFGAGEIPPISHGVCLVEGRWALHSQ